MIIVTGATGTIGREVVRILHEGGHDVRALVRDAARAAGSLPQGVERVVGDLAQPATLPSAFAGADRLFLLDTGLDVDHTAAAVAAAGEAGIRHVVHVSWVGAVLDPMPPVGHVYADKERVVEASGIGATALAPTTLMKNALAWAPGIRTEGVVRDATAPGRLSSVDTDDVAAVAAVALTEPGHAGQAYVLTGGELLTAREQVEILAGVLDRSIDYVARTPEEAARALAAGGVPPAFVAAARDFDEVKRTGRIDFLTDTVRRLTGREPTRFESWCRRNAGQFA